MYHPCASQTSAECSSHNPQNDNEKSGFYPASSSLVGSFCYSCTYLTLNAMQNNDTIIYTPDPSRNIFIPADFSSSAGKDVKWIKKKGISIPPLFLRQQSEKKRAQRCKGIKRTIQHNKKPHSKELKKANEARARSKQKSESKSCDLYIYIYIYVYHYRLLTKIIISFIVYCILLRCCWNAIITAAGDRYSYPNSVH